MLDVEYLKPQSLQDVHTMLSEHGDKARIIAGGTDMLVHLKKKSSLPDRLIAIDSLQNLNYIRDDKDGLRIGALTKIHDIEISKIVRDKYPILRQAVSVLGTPSIRRQATIGGNLCNASPCADSAPPLLVMGALLKISSLDGERTIPVEDFFTGPGQTCLDSNEFLKEIHIPTQIEEGRGIYLKMTRSRGADLAIASVAALIVMDGDVVKNVKIAMGSVAPTPIRAKKTEIIMSGKKLDKVLLDECAQAAQVEARPIDDVRSSAENRKNIIKTLVKRAIKQAAETEI